mmetsp:Transcript_14324/g.34922  ORF Transcript_14324/g.34922 Transcript_14324/m.34922 type:complete len:114 (-) Transcript_14324:1876-2217(-)
MFGGGGPLSLAGGGGAVGAANKVKIVEVKGWIKEAAAVPEGVTMMVTELKCKQDNCPPFETIMVIMHGAQGGGNQKRRIHSRLGDLTREVVAAAWAEQESEEGFMPPGVLGGP